MCTRTQLRSIALWVRIAALAVLVLLVGGAGSVTIPDAPQITYFKLINGNVTTILGLAAPNSVVTVYAKARAFVEGGLGGTTDAFRLCDDTPLATLGQAHADASGSWSLTGLQLSV